MFISCKSTKFEYFGDNQQFIMQNLITIVDLG